MPLHIGLMNTGLTAILGYRRTLTGISLLWPEKKFSYAAMLKSWKKVLGKQAAQPADTISLCW
jgi:hypothetical protein